MTNLSLDTFYTVRDIAPLTHTVPKPGVYLSRRSTANNTYHNRVNRIVLSVQRMSLSPQGLRSYRNGWRISDFGLLTSFRRVFGFYTLHNQTYNYLWTTRLSCLLSVKTVP